MLLVLSWWSPHRGGACGLLARSGMGWVELKLCVSAPTTAMPMVFVIHLGRRLGPHLSVPQKYQCDSADTATAVLRVVTSDATTSFLCFFSMACWRHLVVRCFFSTLCWFYRVFFRSASEFFLYTLYHLVVWFYQYNARRKPILRGVGENIWYAKICIALGPAYKFWKHNMKIL